MGINVSTLYGKSFKSVCTGNTNVSGNRLCRVGPYNLVAFHIMEKLYLVGE